MKYLKGLFCIAVLIATVLLCALTGSATQYSDIEEQYEHMLDGIPSDIADLLPEGIFSRDVQQIGEAVKQMSSFEYIISAALNFLGVGAKSALELFATLLALVVLSSLLRNVRSLVRSPALSGAISFCSSAVLVGAITAIQYDNLVMVTSFLDRLNVLASSMLPIMGVLYAMGGNVTAAVVNNSGMMVFLTVCEAVCNRTVFPVTALCLCFSLAAALSPGVDMKGIAGVVKKSFTVLIGFVMTLLMTVLAAQSTLAAAADGVAARTAKFVAGSFIPVVGSSVGDSLKTVAAGVKYIRASVGIMGVVIIALLVLPPLLSVMLTRLAVMLSGAAARLLGCSEEASVLGELTNIYGYLMAVISACSVMFIFALTLLAHTSAAVGG